MTKPVQRWQIGDVAVLRVVRGNYGFIDAGGARMKGTQRLLCELTLRDGRVVYDLNGLSREDWGDVPGLFVAFVEDPGHGLELRPWQLV